MSMETVELVGGPRDGERFTTPEVMDRIETVDPFTPDGYTSNLSDLPACSGSFHRRSYRRAGMRDDGTWWYEECGTSTGT